MTKKELIEALEPCNIKIGKIYRHESLGKRMRILGLVKSDAYGICYVAETDTCDFVPVSLQKEDWVNWIEVIEWN